MEVAIIERMGRESGSLDGLRPRRFDLVLVGAAVLMSIVTVILAADVDMRLVIVDRTLDVAVTTLTMLAAAGLALLTLPRYSESGRLSLLLQASAFVLTATFTGMTVVLVLSKLDAQLGMTLGDPEQLPMYVTAITRLVTGALFLAAGLAAVRRIRSRVARPRMVLLAPSLLILGLTILAYPVRDLLAPLIDEEGIRILVSDTTGSGRLRGHHPAGHRCRGRDRAGAHGSRDPVPLQLCRGGHGVRRLPRRSAS